MKFRTKWKGIKILSFLGFLGYVYVFAHAVINLVNQTTIGAALAWFLLVLFMGLISIPFFLMVVAILISD